MAFLTFKLLLLNTMCSMVFGKPHLAHHLDKMKHLNEMQQEDDKLSQQAGFPSGPPIIDMGYDSSPSGNFPNGPGNSEISPGNSLTGTGSSPLGAGQVGQGQPAPGLTSGSQTNLNAPQPGAAASEGTTANKDYTQYYSGYMQKTRTNLDPNIEKRQFFDWQQFTKGFMGGPKKKPSDEGKQCDCKKEGKKTGPNPFSMSIVKPEGKKKGKPFQLDFSYSKRDQTGVLSEDGDEVTSSRVKIAKQVLKDMMGFQGYSCDSCETSDPKNPSQDVYCEMFCDTASSRPIDEIDSDMKVGDEKQVGDEIITRSQIDKGSLFSGVPCIHCKTKKLQPNEEVYCNMFCADETDENQHENEGNDDSSEDEVSAEEVNDRKELTSVEQPEEQEQQEGSQEDHDTHESFHFYSCEMCNRRPLHADQDLFCLKFCVEMGHFHLRSNSKDPSEDAEDIQKKAKLYLRHFLKQN